MKEKIRALFKDVPRTLVAEAAVWVLGAIWAYGGWFLTPKAKLICWAALIGSAALGVYGLSGQMRRGVKRLAAGLGALALSAAVFYALHYRALKNFVKNELSQAREEILQARVGAPAKKVRASEALFEAMRIRDKVRELSSDPAWYFDVVEASFFKVGTVGALSVVAAAFPADPRKPQPIRLVAWGESQSSDPTSLIRFETWVPGEAPKIDHPLESVADDLGTVEVVYPAPPVRDARVRFSACFPGAQRPKGGARGGGGGETCPQGTHPLGRTTFASLDEGPWFGLRAFRVHHRRLACAWP